MLGSDTSEQDKPSLFYLYWSRFIVPRKSLYQWGQCFLSIGGEWSMNRDECWHKYSPSSFLFYQICPVHPLLFLRPFHFLSTHSRIHFFLRKRQKSVSGWLDSWTTGTFTQQCFVIQQCGRTRCSWVVRQNNKPLSCHVNWSMLNRLSIRSTYKCALSTPTY